MKRRIDLGAHVLLGLIFFVFGLNGFLNFLPVPELPERVARFMGALMETGYFFPVLKAVEVVGGALLLARRFVPLALVLLAPVVVHIFLFHAFMTPGIGNLPLPIVLVVLEAYLGFVVYRDSFRSVLAAKPR